MENTGAKTAFPLYLPAREWREMDWSRFDKFYSRRGAINKKENKKKAMERKSKKERKEDLSDLYFRYLIEGKIRAGMGRGTRVHCRWKEVSRDQRRSFASSDALLLWKGFMEEFLNIVQNCKCYSHFYKLCVRIIIIGRWNINQLNEKMSQMAQRTFFVDNLNLVLKAVSVVCVAYSNTKFIFIN